MNISFGKKFPIASCSIINEACKQPQSATIFEHDCKDITDYEFFKNLSGIWEYKDNVAKAALDKFNFPLSNLGTKIYSLETNKGKITGIMETTEYGKTCVVEHLESHYKGLYSYSGSTLLAFLAQQKINQNVSSIYITNPAKKARRFYTQHCFFQQNGPLALELNKKGMEELIKKTKKKTKNAILDLKG